jgi:LysM repeat protein
MTWLKVVHAVCMVLVLAGAGAGCAPVDSAGGGEENDPDFQAGLRQKKAGRHVQAIDSLERALQRNPRSAAAHFELGLVYYQHITNHVAAIYHFDKVQRLRPDWGKRDIVRQLITVCKQELVREVIGSFNVQMRHELERMDKLTRENTELRQQLDQLKAEYAARTAAGTPNLGAQTARSPEPGVPSSQGASELAGMRPAGGSSLPSTVPPSGVTRAHRVQGGDTFYSLARRYGVQPSAIQAANPGIRPNQIQPGQVLRIPPPR